MNTNKFYVLILFLVIPTICGMAQVENSHTLDSLIDLAWEHRYDSKKIALSMTSDALSLANKIGEKKAQATCFNILGIIYRNQNNFDSSLLLFNHSFEIRMGLHDTIGMASIHNNIGALYSNNGQFNEAFTHLIQAAEFYEIENMQRQLGLCYDNIANVLDDQGNFKKAIEYNQTSLKIHLAEGDTMTIADSRLNLAERYLNLGKIDKAISSASKALNAYISLNDWESEAIAHSVLGDIYFEENNVEKAKENYKKSIDLYLLHNDYSSGLMYTYWAMAKLNTETGDPDTALKLIEKSEAISSRSTTLENERYISELKSNAFVELGRHDSAFYYSKKMSEYQDSIYKEQSSRQFAEMQTKYETEKTERELIEEKLVSQRNKNQKNIFLAVAVAIFALAIFGYLYFRQRQKAAITISKQKEKIHQQEVEELLKTQELTAINSMLEGQEKERLRIAKDLHDRLGSMLTTVKWRFDSFSENNTNKEGKENIEQASSMLDEAYHEVRRISHDMVSGVLTNFGLLPALKELANKISGGGKLQVKIISNGLNERLNSKLEITIYRVIQELLSNILKHANATETIVQLTQINGELSVTVEDNGKGFNLEKIKHGMGIRNVEARVQSLDGSVFFDSGKGNGTTVLIEIPIKNEQQ